MCGITGIIDRKQAISSEIIQKMTSVLGHRGPDGQAWLQVVGGALGHSRLSIIDLITGEQPMSDITGRWWIVFNGEIYNYREIRKDLELRGCHFRTSSDTEVILQAYLGYGEKALSQLNGQFAFAIWDTHEKTLFAARDRLGEKPFFFTTAPGGQFLFASEIKAILASGLITPKLSLSAVDDYLALLYVSPGKTIYENVHVLPPGHALRWKGGQVQIFRYWEPRFGGCEKIDPREAVEEIQRLIACAVHRQMVSDVPIGAFLSGGLDSSTVVALMVKYSSQPVKTFSVGFGDLIDELPYARSVAQQYETEHHEIQMEISVAEMLEKMSAIYDEPFADSSNIPTFLISQYARQYVKVVLSGDGGDEVFGGYSWYAQLLADDTDTPSSAQLSLTRAQILTVKILSKLHLVNAKSYSQTRRDLKQIEQLRAFPDVFDRHISRSTYMNPALRYSLWGEKFSSFEQIDLDRPADDLHGLDRAFYFDFAFYLPGDILTKVDRAAMANGLEVRAPFLDVELVEFVLSLPSVLRLHGNQLKYLLHQSSAHLWPEKIVNRPKQGFGAPLSSWIESGDVRSLAARIVRKNGALESLFPSISNKYQGLNEQQKWSFLCLGLWLENHSEII